jgi:hypothetical protein
MSPQTLYGVADDQTLATNEAMFGPGPERFRKIAFRFPSLAAAYVVSDE